MAIIKSHLCKSCGGLLNIDLDRQLYLCPFCGITYDYEYFREENVLDISRRALNRGEFGSAKEAFEFALQKDPHNFEALRGLFLCNCKWRTMSPILHNEKVHVKDTDPALQMALEKALPDNKEFFENIRDSLNILYEYRNNKTEIKKLEDEREVHSKRLNALYMAKAANNEKFSQAFQKMTNEMDESQLAAILIGGFVLLLLIIGSAIGSGMWAFALLMLGLIAGIAAIVVIVYNITKAVTNKQLEAAIKPVRERVDQFDNNIENIRTQNKNLLAQYKTLTQKIVLADNKFNESSAPGNPEEDDMSGAESEEE